MAERRSTRRELLKKAVYVLPAMLTLTAVPAFASAGSGSDQSGDDLQQGGRRRSRGGNWWTDFLALLGIE